LLAVLETTSSLIDASFEVLNSLKSLNFEKIFSLDNCELLADLQQFSSPLQFLVVAFSFSLLRNQSVVQ